jgi:hypothetical protein
MSASSSPKSISSSFLNSINFVISFCKFILPLDLWLQPMLNANLVVAKLFLAFFHVSIQIRSIHLEVEEDWPIITSKEETYHHIVDLIKKLK